MRISETRTIGHRSLDQDGPIALEKVLQGELPDKADGAAVEFTLNVFVLHQGLANLPDMDM